MSNKPIYLSKTSLARQVGIAQQTLDKRLKSGALIADGVIVTGDRTPGPVFLVSRLPEIRALFTHPHRICA